MLELILYIHRWSYIVLKINRDNCYLKEHYDKEHKIDGYSICIEMPDESRNYLHTQPFPIDTALAIRDEILEREINKADIELRWDDYYNRLYFGLRCNDNQLLLKLANAMIIYFHSRKLNLNDAIYERDMFGDK